MSNRYMEACRQWLQTLLGYDGFPSSLVTSADKEAFIKGIMGCRSLKRFKQVAHEFSIKCRGLENTAYGTAL
ncbi:hypothetical protein BCR43DRAFT_275674 [Syncephalastrum racemosum]|uniref:Uncharacterized protein n=1 Tax=Syncephalastrum racemosum TaxID=13706 RepID=A0A1X2HC95_SYNRA|nr:hypothetical protein BCR43DRAFT_275674 [Syncephalastrum racemosum]